jgi:hypothetical protein
MKRRTPAPSADAGVRQYRVLLNHCDTCPECNADTSRACPEASRLRRAASLARRGVTA